MRAATRRQTGAGAERAPDCYACVDDGKLVLVADGTPAPALAQRVHDAFRALVLDPQFPCVGARSALNQGSYRFGMYRELDATTSTDALAHDLRAFIDEQPRIEGEFTTFIACFDTPKVLDAPEFERLLWAQLHALHARDDAPWDAAVARDPEDAAFSFSFGGRAFFIVGLAPSGERWARTFPWPVLVFNAHEQFEALRRNGQFRRMQDVIRQRDEQLEGDINPNLAEFGEHTEARQYSGREVAGDWRCPVRFDD
ncbi:MAG: YqcI/YcgG family protein [Dehalococcoidia bacterium]|nr:YqcI/YcgG family protein [Dehalococcoidia bacterium]